MATIKMNSQEFKKRISEILVSNSSNDLRTPITGVHFTENIILHEEYYCILILNGKTYIENLFITGNAIISELFIEGDTQIKTLFIDENAKIDSINFSERVSIESIEVAGNVTISNISIGGNSKVDTLNITESAKLTDLHCYGDAIVNDIYISENALVEDFSVGNEAEVLSIEVSGVSKVRHIDFDYFSKVSIFQVLDGAEINTLNISGKAQVKRMNFEGGTILNSIVFQHWKTDEVSINKSGTIFPIKFLIDNLEVKKLSFCDFHSSSHLQISNVSPACKSESYIEFTRSTFDNLELIGNDWGGFDCLVFENSNLTSTFIAGTIFPKDVRVRGKKSTNDSGDNNEEILSLENSLEGSKMFYEQIKTVYQKQGNRTEALKYQALELAIHYNSLTWRNDSKDKLMLWFNKWSTNYGTNWVQGFLFFIAFTIVLYTLTLLSTDGVYLIWPWKVALGDYNLYLSNYFDFINPTSYIWKRWDYIYELNGGEIDVGVKSLLLFSKVIIVTIIYQIIQAFRKYGKS